MRNKRRLEIIQYVSAYAIVYAFMCTFFLLNNASTFYILPTLKGLAWVYDKLIVLKQETSGFETPTILRALQLLNVTQQ